MSEILFESSGSIIVFGLFILVPLVILANHYRNLRIWIGAGIVAALIVAAVALERYVITPREAVTKQLVAIANHVERNEHDQLIEYFSSSRPDVIALARSEMSQYDFDKCNIAYLNEVKVDENNPNKAIADFTVAATLLYQGHKQTALRDVLLTFEKEADGVWRLVDYSHSAPFKKPGALF